MTSDEIVGSYALLNVHEPMPEEIVRAISEARRLRAQAFCGAVRAAAATWLARAFRAREVQLAHAGSAPNPAPTA
jgi:hypothetical protein